MDTWPSKTYSWSLTENAGEKNVLSFIRLELWKVWGWSSRRSYLARMSGATHGDKEKAVKRWEGRNWFLVIFSFLNQVIPGVDHGLLSLKYQLLKPFGLEFLPVAIRIVLIQANWIPVFLNFNNIKFMLSFVMHKTDVCCISLHILKVTLQLFGKATWHRERSQT